MVFKKMLAGATAMAIVIAPEVALAQTSAAGVGAPAVQALPAAESVDGDSEMFQERRRRRGFIIPLFAIVLIGLGIYIALINDNDGPPISP